MGCFAARPNTVVAFLSLHFRKCACVRAECVAGVDVKPGTAGGAHAAGARVFVLAHGAREMAASVRQTNCQTVTVARGGPFRLHGLHIFKKCNIQQLKRGVV